MSKKQAHVGAFVKYGSQKGIIESGRHGKWTVVFKVKPTKANGYRDQVRLDLTESEFEVIGH